MSHPTETDGPRRFTASSLLSRKAVIFELAFAVAFCSIVYELAYAEMLRTFYGGTVTQYVMNVGLFMFGFGIGSAIYDYLDKERVTFTHVEMALAVAGPLGLGWIIGINLVDPAYLVFGSPTPDDPNTLYAWLTRLPYYLSYIPALAIGMLSGLELPFLTEIAGDEDDWQPPRWYSVPVNRTVAALPLLRLPEDRERTAFSVVLGIDYFGSLAGTSVYALVMFPTIGLIPSVVVLGLINGVAALVYHLKFVANRPASVGDVVFLRFAKPLRVAFLVTLLFTGLWAGLVVNHDQVERSVSEAYLEGRMEISWPTHDMQYEATETFTTKYQRVTMYERTWTGPDSAFWGASSDRCLYLDGQVQLCDSWGQGYHAGLVDVPMAYFNNTEDVDVLVVGGGDWAAVNHLRDYNASVDLVDIDREFMNYTKDKPFFERFHNDAYEYDRLDVHHTDALTYLRNTDEEYDLVLLDLPGARDDDLTKFYSKEFFHAVRDSLSDHGIVATWGYNRAYYSEHYKAYMNTVRDSGFDHYLAYEGYQDVDNSTGPERIEYFYLFSPHDDLPSPDFNRSESPLIQRHRDRYARNKWRSTPHYRGVKVHSIFDPNYDIIIGHDD